MIVAGFDEAGYGPTLGPLVVGSTAFEVPGEDPWAGEPDLWELLEGAVRREAKGRADAVWVADSKAIKPRKDGVKQLELGVLAFLDQRERSSLRDLLERLGAGREHEHQPWFGDFEQVEVPGLAWPGEVAARAERIAAAAQAAGVRYLGAEVRLLSARTYNARVRATGNKSLLLEEACVSMLASLRRATRGPLRVTCDKHGGRSDYLRLCGLAFPNAPLDVLEEGAEVSTYAVRASQGPVWITFRKGGEDQSLAVALASMHCKYLRERCMERFNAWFQERVPGLAATAGYALDARRFLREVEPHLGELGVAREVLERSR